MDIQLGELLQLRDLVRSYCGLLIEEAKLQSAKERLVPLIEANGCSSLSGLCQILLREIAFGTDTVFREVVTLFTINETYFFREQGQLDQLREQVVPELVAAGNSGPLRLLSLPCSSGEEPFSIAMTLDELPLGTANPGFEILGIDIDAKAIQKAVAGVYPRSAFRTTPSRFLERYFSPDGGGYVANTALQGRVRFQQGNILALPADLRSSAFDVIFCRNLLIYFDKATQAKVIAAILELLKPGGYLFVGHSESLLGFDVPLQPISTPDAIYYRRPGSASTAGKR